MELGERMFVDVVLLENFIIDFFLLKITSRLSKFKTTKPKLILGAAVGALYVVVIFFPSLKIFFNISIKVAISVLMIIIAFTPDKFRDFFRALSVFYIISFAFGGAAFAVFYFTGNGTIVNGIFFIRDFPLSMLITAFVLGYLLLNSCWAYIQDRVINEKLIYNVIVELKDKSVKTNAILDTGNSLKEPISNFPVIVVEYEVFKDILPEDVMNVFNNTETGIINNKLYDTADDSEWIMRIRLIPFSSLGKQNGMLVGIKPDLVKLDGKKCSREVKDVIIGLYNHKLSKSGEYQALLYPEILK